MENQGTQTLQDSEKEFLSVDDAGSKVKSTSIMGTPESNFAGITHSLTSMLEPSKAPKLITVIVILGFIVMVYSGNMNFKNLLFYAGFLLFSGVFYLVVDAIINATSDNNSWRKGGSLLLGAVFAFGIFMLDKFKAPDNYYLMTIVAYFLVFILVWYLKFNR